MRPRPGSPVGRAARLGTHACASPCWEGARSLARSSQVAVSLEALEGRDAGTSRAPAALCTVATPTCPQWLHCCVSSGHVQPLYKQLLGGDFSWTAWGCRPEHLPPALAASPRPKPQQP